MVTMQGIEEEAVKHGIDFNEFRKSPAYTELYYLADEHTDKIATRALDLFNGFEKETLSIL